MAIIDLGALQPEPLEIKLPSGTTYTIPASVSVKYITKLMNLQAKTAKVKNQMEYIGILQNIAFEILSLDKSKDVTMDTVKNELDDILLLKALPQLFNDHLGGILQEVIPQKEEEETNPNSTTPLEN